VQTAGAIGVLRCARHPACAAPRASSHCPRADAPANLALALAQTANLGRPPRIGLLDLDIFGPSVPKLFGLENAGDPRLSAGECKGAPRHASCTSPKLQPLTLARHPGPKNPAKRPENKLIPLQNHGIKTMSIGYLLRAWRFSLSLPHA
jgi:ATP-binding protein involved in chromosome partitioning